MENLTINQGIKFTAADGTGVIGIADPSGSQGISKGSSETGFYIQSSVNYTLWFYDGSAWSAHQSIDTAESNYKGGFAFAWESNTAAYIKTADASHEVFVFGRDGDLRVDNTPGDASQEADTIVDGTGSLSITAIDAQNDYTSGVSVSNDGTVSFNRTDQNAAYSLSFEGTGVVIGNNGDSTVTIEADFSSVVEYDVDGNISFGGQVSAPYNTLTDGATITPDFNDSNNMVVTLAGNRAMANPSNLKDGASYTVIVKQDATGGRTLSFGTSFKWAGGTAPTLSTGANAVDILTFVSDGTNLFGSFVGDFQ